jgi:hypothetical protein
MPDLADLVPVAPERVPALAHGPALDRPVRVALVVLLVLAAHHPRVKHRARSVPLPAEAVADARSTPRPKKAQ